MKKIIYVIMAILLLPLNALAADNSYTYNKYVYNNIRPEIGVCNFDASFVGHEVEYNNVNDYFKGLIGAFMVDLNNDGTEELITVESRSVKLYTIDGKEVTFCDKYSTELIGNNGDSYSNVFVKDAEGTEFLGVETFTVKNGETEYKLDVLFMDPQSRTFEHKAYVYQKNKSDGFYQTVSKDGINVFSHNVSNGMTTGYDPNGFTSVYMAAKDALWGAGITDEFLNRPDRLEYDASQYGTAHRISDYVHETRVMTYITGKGVRTAQKPVVIFKDYSNLNEFLKPAYDIKVTINNEELAFADQEPVIINNRTLVPVRAIFEAIGADVSWLPASQRVVANTADTNVTMQIGNNDYFVNGAKKYLDVPPMLLNDRTMIPARAAAEAFGCIVDWDDSTKTVIIKN